MNVILGMITAVAVLFLAALMSTVMGGVVGWCVEAVFPYVPATLNKLAGTDLTGFELGAVLGFFGSFFRSTLNTK